MPYLTFLSNEDDEWNALELEVIDRSAEEVSNVYVFNIRPRFFFGFDEFSNLIVGLID